METPKITRTNSDWFLVTRYWFLVGAEIPLLNGDTGFKETEIPSSAGQDSRVHGSDGLGVF